MPGKPKKRDWDDGSTVADMNVDGMPWVSKRRHKPRVLPKKPEPEQTEPPLTRKETWHLVLNAIAASLLIGLVFAVVLFLFILFCINVWFK